MKHDDKEEEKDLKKALSELDKGNKALDRFQMQTDDLSSSDSTSNVAAVQTEQTTAVVSSLSIEVSLPTNIII